jgi:hypothetical protein
MDGVVDDAVRFVKGVHDAESQHAHDLFSRMA